MRCDTCQRSRHCGLVGAVAAHEPVRSEEPDVARPADRVDRRVGDIIGSVRPWCCAAANEVSFPVRETHQREVEAQRGKGRRPRA